MARSNISDKDRNRIATRAHAITRRKRDSGQRFFQEVTAWANDRCDNTYSVSQISAMLGRMGFVQDSTTGRGYFEPTNAY